MATDDFIAVIDGSTSKSTKRCHRIMTIGHHSNGELAMRLVSRFIKRMPKDISFHQFCIQVTGYVKSHYRKSMLTHLAEHPEDRLTASAVVFSRLRREIWMIGDCQCLVAPTVGNASDAQDDRKWEYIDNPKPQEKELAERRASIILSSQKPRESFLENDSARNDIIPLMLTTMKEQNKSYSVIDGFRIPEDKTRVVTLDFNPWEIVLASDGYPFLCSTLALSEEKLMQQKQRDPLNIGQFKATKAFMNSNNSFDDRAYIRFRA